LIRKANFGCGGNVLDGYENYDKYMVDSGVRFLDLDVLPLPFDDNTFCEIKLLHVLEHIQNPQEVLVECTRVLVVGGILEIGLPVNSNGVGHLRYVHSTEYLNLLYKFKDGKKRKDASNRCLRNAYDLLSFEKSNFKDVSQFLYGVKVMFNNFWDGLFHKNYTWKLRKK